MRGCFAMLRLVRAGARAWLPPTRCQVRPGLGAGSKDQGWRVQASSLILAHPLQRLNVLAEEAVQPPEKPEPVASAGEVAGVAPLGSSNPLPRPLTYQLLQVPRHRYCENASSRYPHTGGRCRPGSSPCGASSRSA